MNKFEKLSLFFLPFIIFIVFREWFSFSLISAGDFSLTQSSFKDLSLLPYSWVTDRLGYFNLPTSWLFYPVMLPAFIGNYFSIPWELTERIFLLYPLLALLFIAPIFLFKKLFPNYKFFYLSGLIFALNTYVLMLIGGGQIYLALAYSIAPLVLYLFIKSFSQPSLVRSLILGFALSLQVMFDLRFAYITVISFLIYLILNFSTDKKYYLNVFYSLLLPGAITFLIHAYWIIPTFLVGREAFQSFGEEYTTSGIIDFFSFARMENSLSLLHPNWPENLFGKVYFMKPEFLILPILAYTSLFFVNRESRGVKKKIVFFALLGLIGAFLAKGTNEPFGGVYTWLFDHIPGFIMFRDPTKWYVLVALSYSILIPYSIYKIFDWLRSHNQFSIKNRIYNFQNLFLILACFYLLFLIRPALLGELNGTFKSSNIPNDYLMLERFISNDSNFFRTLWFPTNQRFGYYSNLHPQISAHSLFNSTDYSNVLKNIRMNQNLLEQSSIKYIVVPFDSEGEIFLTDRIYDQQKYLRAIKDISKIKRLKKINCCGKIAVFEVSNPKDHFWSTSSDLKISYEYKNPTKYTVSLNNAREGDLLVFSESFDKNWEIRNSEFKVASSKFNNRFNSFRLPKDGNYSFEVYYTPQDWVNIGIVISLASLITTLALLIYLYKRK